MPPIFAFPCARCGKIHEGSPSVGYDSPWQYDTLSEEQKKTMGSLSSDFCTIQHDEGSTDYFVRAILKVPIHDVEEPFLWGVWVSLSEKSYHRYVETYDDPVEGDVFFGWLCNKLPCYPDTASLASDVHIQTGNKRPIVHLHEGGEDEHPLVQDQREGITAERAQEILEQVMHGRRDRDVSVPKPSP